MDNQAYLDQIAVKGKVKSGPILTPKLIKIIATGIILLITMIIVGNVINESNTKVQQSFERTYWRIENLSNDKSPIRVYLNRVKDSNLRSYATSLLSSLRNSSIAISDNLAAIGIGKKPTAAVKNKEIANLDELTSYLDNAILTGTIDETFAAQVYYQINVLLAYEAEARSKTTSKAYAEILDASTADLTLLRDQFKTYNESND